MTLDACRKYWTSGLQTTLKRGVRTGKPATFDEAVTLAMDTEDVEVSIQREHARTMSGKRPAPKEKSRSGDVATAEYAADEAAGLTSHHTKTSTTTPEVKAIDDEEFAKFHNEMGAEEDDSLTDLLQRFQAWKLYSKVIPDPVQLKAFILKISSPKTKATTSVCEHCKKPGHGLVDCRKLKFDMGEVSCSFCKKTGHTYQACEELKAKREN